MSRKKRWGFQFESTVLIRALMCPRGLDPYLCVLPSSGHCALRCRVSSKTPVALCIKQATGFFRVFLVSQLQFPLPKPGNMCGLACVRSVHHMSLITFHHRKFLHVEAPFCAQFQISASESLILKGLDAHAETEYKRGWWCQKIHNLTNSAVALIKHMQKKQYVLIYVCKIVFESDSCKK